MTTSSTQTLLDGLKIDELLPEEQEELLLDLNELVFKGTMVRMLEIMDEVTKDEFEKLMDSDADEETIQAFLDKNVPEADKMVGEVVEELRSDILAVTGESQD